VWCDIRVRVPNRVIKRNEDDKQHASTILRIDSTHETYQYRFKLITIVVPPDDIGNG